MERMWLRRLLLPIFYLKLLIVTSPTLVKLGAAVAKQYALPLSLLFFIAVLSSFAITRTSPLTKAQVALARLKPLSHPLIQLAPARDLPAELQAWQALYQLQPHHRDILLNLSQVAREMGNETQAEQYQAEARQLDPNSPLFETK